MCRKDLKKRELLALEMKKTVQNRTWNFGYKNLFDTCYKFFQNEEHIKTKAIAVSMIKKG